MPLDYSKSKKSFGNNVKAEMAAGKPQAQSVAIAYSVQRKGKPGHHEAKKKALNKLRGY